jgi:hypothetical protein
MEERTNRWNVHGHDCIHNQLHAASPMSSVRPESMTHGSPLVNYQNLLGAGRVGWAGPNHVHHEHRLLSHVTVVHAMYGLRAGLYLHVNPPAKILRGVLLIATMTCVAVNTPESWAPDKMTLHGDFHRTSPRLHLRLSTPQLLLSHEHAPQFNARTVT